MSYLVRLIAETVVDKTFLSFAIVLAVCVFGFADAFLSVREAVAVDKAQKEAALVQAATLAAALWAKSTASNVTEPAITDPAITDLAVETGLDETVEEFKRSSINKYISDENLLKYSSMLKETYLLTLGEFEFFPIDEEEQFYWMFFIVATIIQLIVMLNLLVSILGEVFGRVEASKVEYAYKEKCVQITALQRLIGTCISRNPSKQKLLFFAAALDKNEIEDEIDTLEELQSKVSQLIGDMEDIKNKVNDVSDKIDPSMSGQGSSEGKLKSFLAKELGDIKALFKTGNMRAKLQAKPAATSKGSKMQQEVSSKLGSRLVKTAITDAKMNHGQKKGGFLGKLAKHAAKKGKMAR